MSVKLQINLELIDEPRIDCKGIAINRFNMIKTMEKSQPLWSPGKSPSWKSGGRIGSVGQNPTFYTSSKVSQKPV